jgi:drug/metabolite transporter (DMT)-like permease
MWVVFTLICALSLATADALTKKALRDTDEYVVGWLRLLIAVPPLLAVLFFIDLTVCFMSHSPQACPSRCLPLSFT